MPTRPTRARPRGAAAGRRAGERRAPRGTFWPRRRRWASTSRPRRIPTNINNDVRLLAVPVGVVLAGRVALLVLVTDQLDALPAELELVLAEGRLDDLPADADEEELEVVAGEEDAEEAEEQQVANAPAVDLLADRVVEDPAGEVVFVRRMKYP